MRTLQSRNLTVEVWPCHWTSQVRAGIVSGIGVLRILTFSDPIVPFPLPVQPLSAGVVLEQLQLRAFGGGDSLRLCEFIVKWPTAKSRKPTGLLIRFALNISRNISRSDQMKRE